MTRRKRHLGVPKGVAGARNRSAPRAFIAVPDAAGRSPLASKAVDRAYVILDAPNGPHDLPMTRERVHGMLDGAARSVRQAHGEIHLYVRPGAWGEGGGVPSAWAEEWFAAHPECRVTRHAEKGM